MAPPQRAATIRASAFTLSDAGISWLSSPIRVQCSENVAAVTVNVDAPGDFFESAPTAVIFSFRPSSYGARTLSLWRASTVLPCCVNVGL